MIEAGACLLELREALIALTKVFFDRSALLEAIWEQRAAARVGPYGSDNPYQETEHADGDFG